MIVGCVKEIKNNENRVGLTPRGAKELTERGHKVIVEKNAGAGSNFSDKEYAKAGARIESNPKKIAQKSDLVLKVKEPLKREYDYFNEDNLIFTYFHFASGPELSREMVRRKANCIAYETVLNKKGRTVLLDPMSRVAGQMAVLQGAYYLAKFAGGNGKLLSKVNGVNPGKVLIIGGGTVGENAAKNALGLRSEVIMFELEKRVRQLKKKYPKMTVLKSEKKTIAREIKDADLLVGAVYIQGAKAPHLVTKQMVKSMRPGSVITDVAIDQGGCIETIRPTSHSQPVYTKYGIIHYAVTNMPGAYPRTSTLALNDATLPYTLKLADQGLEALRKDHGFLAGLNTRKGFMTNESVAKQFRLPYMHPLEALDL